LQQYRLHKLICRPCQGYPSQQGDKNPRTLPKLLPSNAKAAPGKLSQWHSAKSQYLPEVLGLPVHPQQQQSSNMINARYQPSQP
jgi:hypothetical protein